MANVNKVIILGRVGSEPETRTMANGACVCNFSVATSETWKDKNTGEKKERTEWHRVVAWRQLGSLCEKYLSKGSLVFLEGKIQTRKYEKNGEDRLSTEIIANDVQFLGGKQERQEPKYPEPPQARPSDDDGGIPF